MPDQGWIACITEDFVEDSTIDRHWSIAPATFGVSIDQWPPPPDGEFPSRFHADEEPSGLSLDDALVWARARAARVSVSLAGGIDYSAGDEPTGEDPLPDGFAVERRRSPDWEFLDRTDADPPMSWDVIIEATIDGHGKIGWEDVPTEERGRWRKALEETPDCEVLEVIDRHHNPLAVRGPKGESGGWAAFSSTPVAVIRLVARTHADATAAAARIANGASATAAWNTTPYIANDAYPTGSQLANSNAHVDSASS